MACFHCYVDPLSSPHQQKTHQSWTLWQNFLDRCMQFLISLPPSYLLIEPVHEISNNVVCATSKASDQPSHTHSLIRAFASRLSILQVFIYWLNTIWSFKLKKRLQTLLQVYTSKSEIVGNLMPRLNLFAILWDVIYSHLLSLARYWKKTTQKYFFLQNIIYLYNDIAQQCTISKMSKYKYTVNMLNWF